MSTPSHQKAIKIASQSEHVSYFMPMLESFQERGELNEVIKNCVAKSCDIWDSGVPLFPNGFKKEDSCGAVRAEFEGYSTEELENIDTVFVILSVLRVHYSEQKQANSLFPARALNY